MKKSNIVTVAITFVVVLAVIIGIINVLYKAEKRHEEQRRKVVATLMVVMEMQMEYCYGEGQYDALTGTNIAIKVVDSSKLKWMWKKGGSPWDNKRPPRYDPQKPKEVLRIARGVI